jgi:hypothetical protein
LTIGKQRYAVWQRTDGASERCLDLHDPIGADDFVLTLVGLAARRYSELMLVPRAL